MNLSENDRRVYAFVRDWARTGRRATVSEAAQATGIPRSSVARVAAHFGYDGWADFTSQLVRYHWVTEPTGTIAQSVSMVDTVLRRHASGFVLVDAIGDAEICVDYMLLRLGELGFRAMPYGKGVVDSIAMSNEQGMLLVLNESGMALLPSCLYAVEHGFEVIAITASHDTPVSKVANLNVVIKNNKSNVSDYRPNYFTAGALSFLERVMASYAREDACE